MKRTSLAVLFLFLCLYGFAQKKPLDHTVYDTWQSLGQKSISNNGLWYSHIINLQEGDSWLILTESNNPSKTLRIDRGTGLRFSNDSKFAATAIKRTYKEEREAKIKKKKTENTTDSLVLIDLANLKTTKIPAVKSFSFPEKGLALLAYLQEQKADDTTKKSKNTKTSKTNTNLVVKNLNTGVEKSFNYVSSYSFSKDGKQLVYVCDAPKDDKENQSGVYMLNTEKWISKTLVNKKGNFKQFIFDEDSEHLAFLGETDPEKKEIKNYSIYYTSLSLDTAQVLVDNEIGGMPKGWAVSGNGQLNFSKDGTKLFFGIAPIAQPKDTTLIEIDHAKLDVWSYKDDYLQTVQLKNVANELKKSYLSVIDIYSSDPKIVPLASEQIDRASLINEGNSAYVLGSSDYKYRIASQWTGRTNKDYYLIDIKTGKSTKIINNLDGYAMASPAGKYILFFNREKGHWYSYQIDNGTNHALTEQINVKFVDEENDMPDYANNYGVSGWTEDDKLVLLNDRYDIWALSPDGKGKAQNLTVGYGRSNNITFKVERLNTEDRFFKKNEKLWLSAFNHITKESGWFRKSLNDHKLPELVVMDKAKLNNLSKAKEAESYLFEKGSFEQSPNYYFSKDLKNSQRISDSNPQQKEYNWGTVELVTWTSANGKTAQGLLYKPEDFDANKKYPMIVYFYERLSDGLYNYQAPAPTPSRLNITYFVSNGYLVFTPDIHYTIGHPGKSAEDYINSGVEHLKKNPWVNGNKIGIQGQSWGGYQVAHLITKTNLYAAAWSGAPVVNMTSAYGGIRWQSGMNRQFQYEKTQSRIGATLWEKPELYIENSPLFNLPKVNTPVVIMANDADGAVPWYQGIEMFTALRRLGKVAWLLNYNNDEHNLLQRQNRKDIQIRQQQFFDYYLKDSKAPSWMVRGIPATEKGKNWGFELVDGKP